MRPRDARGVLGQHEPWVRNPHPEVEGVEHDRDRIHCRVPDRLGRRPDNLPFVCVRTAVIDAPNARSHGLGLGGMRLRVFDSQTWARCRSRSVGLGAMRVEAEDHVLEVINEPLENRPCIPFERSAEAVADGHLQFGSFAKRNQRVVGIADTEVAAADLHVVVERVRREEIRCKPVDPSRTAVRLSSCAGARLTTRRMALPQICWRANRQFRASERAQR